MFVPQRGPGGQGGALSLGTHLGGLQTQGQGYSKGVHLHPSLLSLGPHGPWAGPHPPVSLLAPGCQACLARPWVPHPLGSWPSWLPQAPLCRKEGGSRGPWCQGPGHPTGCNETSTAHPQVPPFPWLPERASLQVALCPSAPTPDHPPPPPWLLPSPDLLLSVRPSLPLPVLLPPLLSASPPPFTPQHRG